VFILGFEFTVDSFNKVLEDISKNFIFYAPRRIPGKGAFSDTDVVVYQEVEGFGQIELDEKSRFSPKEVINPITQTLFYFNENGYTEPETNNKGIIIFCRPCDANSFKRLDEIFLNNGPFKDSYYESLRRKVKIFVIECVQGFENCFCVSMGTNRFDDYDAFIRVAEDRITCDVKDNLLPAFVKHGISAEMRPDFISENAVKVAIPDQVNKTIFTHEMWREYSERCIACGRCTVVCPTCTCFTMQDIFYEDNHKCGERRRVWASCMIDGFTEVAGGHDFRPDKGMRMRFKAMHKIYDFRKRFGYNMCVGCGRCDDVCPEYISFSNCINKVSALSREVNG
jgi:anaerobic sulfite reductase subunit A